MTDYAKLINDMRQLTGIFLTFDVDMALPEGMFSPDDAADAIEALIRERDQALAKLASHETMEPRYISSLLEARAKAIREAADEAEPYNYHARHAILALLEKE
jgi:hypothetical protein